MRVLRRSRNWEARLFGGLLVAAMLGGSTVGWSAQTNAPARQAGGAPVYALLTSPGLLDIVKLESAKVEPEVIKAYIKASPVAYNPSANEIIVLKDRGVPPDVIAAMLQRGGELRAQAGQANPAMAGAPPYPGTANPSTGAQPYDYSSDYGPYPADYDMYGGYPYGYGYPYNYWWWNSAWPGWGWGWGGVGFDSFGHNRFHNFNHFNQFNRFNRFNHFNAFNHFNQFNRFGVNQFGVRFQNNDFNRFGRARFQNFEFNRQAGLNVQSSSFAPFAFSFAPGAFAPNFNAQAARFSSSSGNFTRARVFPVGSGAFRPAISAGGRTMGFGGGGFRGGGGFHGGGGHGGGGGHR